MMERAEAQRAEELLRFGSDRPVRTRWFSPESYGHPAKMHLGLLQWLIDHYTAPGDTVMDPMAGSGGILLAATLQRHVIARDVEPRFLAMMHDNAAHILREAGLLAGSIAVAAADAREPWHVRVDHIITSPPYGNAASVSSDTRRCLPYRFHEPAKMTANSSCSVTFFYGEHPAQIGHLRKDAYWVAMRSIYQQAAFSLRPGGHLIVVIKDHIRGGQRVSVAGDTEILLRGLFTLSERHKRLVYPLSLWQRRRKERGEPVVEDEDVLVFTREEEQRGSD